MRFEKIFLQDNLKVVSTYCPDCFWAGHFMLGFTWTFAYFLIYFSDFQRKRNVYAWCVFDPTYEKVSNIYARDFFKIQTIFAKLWSRGGLISCSTGDQTSMHIFTVTILECVVLLFPYSAQRKCTTKFWKISA